ncbi:sigma-70 family RNA polymerase sigma factor [Luteimonas sp. SJ-92]|uniref:Sigma-70 family RNA polymerase sigma factor n=1 Tax=Luteimonas salinisoli TaxID=2752307 RepID=A0A853JDH2_9GAMM|nr:sigma-70 family RNA polymerase sigma factor [Luteimonas salinisoli]NZA26659.1 sigma-70 family RNA polymerase sigma factor [Luteimonas salinisoli]
MLRAQDGDRAAYHALLQAVTPWLRTIVCRHLGRGEEIEDALQDILLAVHGIRHTYEGGRPLRPWLGTIANRRCIDLLRRRARRLRHESQAVQMSAEPADDGHGPPDASAHERAARDLRQAVDALPERQREAVQLLRLQELSLQEAAERSGQSVGSLKVACHRALKSLRRVLLRSSRHD